MEPAVVLPLVKSCELLAQEKLQFWLLNRKENGACETLHVLLFLYTLRTCMA
jgi:hypothetical protein